MFTSAPTDLSIERLRKTDELISEALDKIGDVYGAEQVSVKVDWEVKKVNGVDELVPVVNISYTT